MKLLQAIRYAASVTIAVPTAVLLGICAVLAGAEQSCHGKHPPIYKPPVR